MSNLATIQKVTNVRNHPNADKLDLVQVLGWQVVVKKGEFKPGDLCVYIAIDSILPEKPEFEFLRNKGFKIKPIRLRGAASAGICFPLSILPNYTPATGAAPYNVPSFGCPTDNTPIIEGTDVTDVIGVKHYQKPVPAELAGLAFGGLPGFLIITDEKNLRSYPDAVPEMYGRPYYITRKDDGCSGTFYVKNNEFGVTSRHIHLKESETNGFWRMAKKYNVENALRSEYPNQDIAIQGEVVGPGIQKNPLGLAELEFHVFNLFDIKTRTYFSYDKLKAFCDKYKLCMVTVITEGLAYGFTVEELVKLANEQMYPNGTPAEGIVIRPKDSFMSVVLKKYWSGKIISENYKEKD